MTNITASHTSRQATAGKKFTPSSRRNPCQLCGDTKGKCRSFPDQDLVLCMELREPPPGWRFAGETKDGLWAKFWPIDPNWKPSAEPKRWEPKPEDKTIVSDSQKDKAYQRILEVGTLNDRHLADFTRRGLTDTETGFLEAVTRSVPTGYLIPFPNADDQFCGAQIRRDDADGGRYRWHYYQSNISLNNEFNEKPLAVWSNGEPVWIVEGTGVKPIVASIRHSLTAIGAAGGLHHISPKTLAYTLERLGSPASVVLCPDAGDTTNPQVMSRIRRNTEALEALGVRVTIAWWGQKTKADRDIDQLPSLDGVRFLTPKEFWSMAGTAPDTEDKRSFLAKLLRMLTPKTKPTIKQAVDVVDAVEPVKVEVVEPTAAPPILYGEGERLQTWQDLAKAGVRNIKDGTDPGGGKSYTSGKVEPKDFGLVQAFYISGDSRNPTVPTLEPWHRLESRHSGLVHEKTADGGTRIRRAKKHQIPATPANCSRSEIINGLRAKTLEADKSGVVCHTCPLYGACASSEGHGFGYLHQRRVALARTRILAHPQSLPSPETFDYSRAIMIWEEASTLATTKEMVATIADVRQAIGFLLEKGALTLDVEALLKALLGILGDKAGMGRHGLGHDAILTGLPTLILESLTNALESLLDAAHELAVDRPDLGRYSLIHDAIIGNLGRLGMMDLFAAHESLFDEASGLTTLILEAIDLEAIRSLFMASLESLNPEIEGVNLSDLPRDQKKFYAAAAKTDDLPSQWLIYFLEVLQGKHPGGTFRIGFDGLTITIPDNRYRNIAAAAGLNIFLDATTSADDLALLFGLEPDQVATVKQTEVATPNLSIKQVKDFGKMGRQRGKDQRRRLEALLKALPDAKVIDYKSEERDGAHFVDGRGVNHFLATKQLVIAGIPCPNLGSLQSVYSALVGKFTELDDPAFQAWVKRKIEAELLQEIGRLRANRRLDESLEVYVLNDFEFSAITPEQVKARDITIAAAGKVERKCWELEQAAKHLAGQGIKLTQRALSAATGFSLGRVNEIIQSLYGGWETFKEICSVLLLDTYIAKPNKQPMETQDVNAMAEVLALETEDTKPETLIKTIVTLATAYGVGALSEILEVLEPETRARLAAMWLSPVMALA